VGDKAAPDEPKETAERTEEPASPPSIPDHQSEDQEITIASWNIRILSNNSRDDDELKVIASLLSKFDIVAVQEVRDLQVLDRLKAMLPGFEYAASPEVGRGQKEIYAFMWKASRVSLVGKPCIFQDPGDLFIREPYVGGNAHAKGGQGARAKRGHLRRRK
jgi:hypothetical protein